MRETSEREIRGPVLDHAHECLLGALARAGKLGK